MAFRPVRVGNGRGSLDIILEETGRYSFAVMGSAKSTVLIHVWSDHIRSYGKSFAQSKI